jgi:hypothetical protein
LLFTAATLILSVLLLLRRKKFWWMSGLASVVGCQIILINYISSFSLLVLNIVLFLFILIGFFFWQFQYQNETIIKNIMIYDNNLNKIVTNEDLLGLPTPIRQWLKRSEVVGKKYIQNAYLEQSGQMRLQPEQKWLESNAKQYFNTLEPSFLWTVETKMNNIPILGRDLFIKGVGSMLIKLASIIPVVNEKSNEKLNEATMQRFLGEIVWFPTAALSEYIKWQEIDPYSAKALMNYKGVTGEATFYFDKNYKLDKFLAFRYRDVSDEDRTLWQAKVNKSKKINGIIIPIDLEASWLPENSKKFLWYKFQIENVKYNEEVPSY